MTVLVQSEKAYAHRRQRQIITNWGDQIFVQIFVHQTEILYSIFFNPLRQEKQVVVVVANPIFNFYSPYPLLLMNTCK